VLLVLLLVLLVEESKEQQQLVQELKGPVLLVQPLPRSSCCSHQRSCVAS
jgi:hypothetical protein